MHGVKDRGIEIGVVADDRRHDQLDGVDRYQRARLRSRAVRPQTPDQVTTQYWHRLGAERHQRVERGLRERHPQIGGKIVQQPQLPASQQVERFAKTSGLEVVRTPASLAELTLAASDDGVVFAGAVGGGYVFPEFLPAYDAVAALCKLLELLTPLDQPLSHLVADLPASTVVHRQLPCP